MSIFTPPPLEYVDVVGVQPEGAFEDAVLKDVY